MLDQYTAPSLVEVRHYDGGFLRTYSNGSHHVFNEEGLLMFEFTYHGPLTESVLQAFISVFIQGMERR